MTPKELERIDSLEKQVEELMAKINELSKTSTFETESLRNDFVALEGRFNRYNEVGFENIQAKIVVGTTDATAGTESTHAHLLPRTPKVVLILPTSNGTIYQSNSPDETNIYLKGSANSLTFIAVCIM